MVDEASDDAVLPGTQVLLFAVTTVVCAVVWPSAPWWLWTAAGLAAVVAVWLWRRVAARRAGNRRATAAGSGRSGGKGRAGTGRSVAGRTGRSGGGTGRSPRRGLFGRSTSGRSGGKGGGRSAGTGRSKADQKAAKKAARADRKAAKKAAKAEARRAKRADKKAARDRKAAKKTDRPSTPTTEPWKRGTGTATKKPPTADRPTTPTARPARPTPKRSNPMSNSDFTPPGTIARITATHGDELMRICASYNPASLANFSDDVKAAAPGISAQAKALKVLAEKVGGFKVNRSIAEQLAIAAMAMEKVAQAVDDAHMGMERLEAETLDRQRNGGIEDRRADISRHQGNG